MNEMQTIDMPTANVMSELYRTVLTPQLERILAPAATEVVRSLYAAIGRADLDALRTCVTDDVVLHVPGTHALGGDHHGFDGFVAFLAGSWQLTGGTERIELIDVLAGASHAAAYCRVQATRPGRAPLDNTTVHVLRMDGERVAEAWLHNWDDTDVNHFWAA
jgi:ketosteroid isomerase-like protein